MVWDLVGIWLLDSQVAEVFRSPFIIPVAGCVMILGMSVASMWAKVRSEEIRSHERLARIAQGLPVEPAWVEEPVRTAGPAPAGRPVPVASRQQVNDGGKARRAGVVLVSIGVGLIGFFAVLAVIVQVREVLSGAAVGVVPLAIGIGFLVDARLKRQEYERHLEWGRSVGGGVQPGMTAGGAPPPPPPPAGMSAAQASDWRPL